MAINYVNTLEVQSLSKEILSLANDFNTEINNLFTRFSEVPTITKEWVGPQSNFYFNKVSLDKKEYLAFANSLKDIGYKLSQDAYEINTCISKNLNAESEKGF